MESLAPLGGALLEHAAARDRDEAAFWIDEVVAAFCSEQATIDRWRAVRAEGA